MRLQFPEGFLLGVSSASAQIEGGEVGSNWNDWYHQGRIKDGSDPAVADDHWNRWREDCALMAGLHLLLTANIQPQLLTNSVSCIRRRVVKNS